MDGELTVRESARRVGRAEETIRRWIWSGRLPARKHGNTYRVSAADLDAVARGVPTQRKGDEPVAPSLDVWLARVREWQGSNGVRKRPGAWRLVLEDRINRAENAGAEHSRGTDDARR